MSPVSTGQHIGDVLDRSGIGYYRIDSRDGSHVVQVKTSRDAATETAQARQVLRSHGYHTQMLSNSPAESQIQVSRNVSGFSKNSPLGRTGTDLLPSGKTGYAALKKSAPPASESEIHAITGYTAMSGMLNRHLRSGGSTAEAPTVHSRRDEMGEPINPGKMSDIDSLMSRSTLPQGAVLWRGMQSHSYHLFGPMGSKVGQTISDTGYLSTSMDPEVAKKFTYPSEALIKVVAPPGTHGVVTEAYSNRYRGQREILLDRSHSYYVHKDSIVNGRRTVELHILPKQTSAQKIASRIVTSHAKQ